MKKINIVALFMVVLVAGFVKCASMDKVSLCKRGCESNYSSCKDEAKDDAKKIVECEAKKTACVKGCEESQ
jgi:hypothetical protein